MKWLKRLALGFLAIMACLALTVILFFVFPGGGEPPAGEDLLLYNGTILTMDPSKPTVEAVALSSGRIALAGTLREATAKLPGARRLDLGGRTLIPGFNDDHTHTFAAGVFYERPVLWGKSCAQIADVVRAEAARLGPGEPILGSSWDYPTCPSPHRSLLDEAAPLNPVFLTQYSGHAAWVNSRQLAALGIKGTTPDPKGGQIVRDAAGEPTGVLRDTAMGASQSADMISRLFVPANHRRVVETMLARYREAGITSVQDNTWEPLTQRLLAKLLGEGRLTARFSCWPRGDTAGLRHLLALPRRFTGWITRGPDKVMADGAFSTRTAWLRAAYADEPGNQGAPRFTAAEIDELVITAARDRRRLAIHVIGDAAAAQAIDAVEKAQVRFPWTKELRMRLEHVQIIAPADIARMKRLGMVASVQPFALCDPVKDVKLLGPARAREAYPYGSLLRAGVPVAFGSDVPAEVDYEPLLGIYYAVTRRDKTGAAGPLNAAEALTPAEALHCYTMGSAYVEGTENEKGSITAGKLADLTVLTGDPTRVPPARIRDIRVAMTIVNGRIVYEMK